MFGQNGLTGKAHLAPSCKEALHVIFGDGNGSSRPHFIDLPKLILLGLNPPKTDGLELLRAVKCDARTRAIPVVVLSASRDEDDLHRCYREGANSYVQKPSNPDQYEKLLGVVPESGAFGGRISRFRSVATRVRSTWGDFALT